MSSGAAFERVRALDAYRGIAVVLMIGAHACDAFLTVALRHADAWHALNIAFGFVAPAFLFLSGAALRLSLADATTSRCRLERRARRYAVILLLAYWLQIPVLSLRQLLWNRRPDELARLFDANVLHVVALGGLLLVALHWLVSSAALRITLAIAIALAVAVAAPYVWSSPATADAWLPVRALVSPQPLSTFPVIPFATYMLVGYAIGDRFVDGAQRGVWAIVGIGCMLIALSALVDVAIGEIHPHDDYWGASIQHTMMRLGVVASIGGIVGLAYAAGARSTLVERIGRASLVIYMLHLMIIYGSPMTIGLRYAFNGVLDRALSPLAVAALVGAISVIVIAAALAWPAARRRWPTVTAVIWWAWWVSFGALFLLTP